MPVYLGPSDTFIVAGKEYHPGDNVPLSKALVAHHEAIGHQFKDTEPEPPTDPVERNVPMERKPTP